MQVILVYQKDIFVDEALRLGTKDRCQNGPRSLHGLIVSSKRGGDDFQYSAFADTGVSFADRLMSYVAFGSTRSNVRFFKALRRHLLPLILRCLFAKERPRVGRKGYDQLS
jgi:hypothetical protein